MTKTQAGVARRKKMLEAIAAYWCRWGYPPSVREVGNDSGLSSSSTVASHLRRMQADGLLDYYPFSTRTIILTEKGWEAAGYSPCVCCGGTGRVR